jgi:hypothetical protein
VHGAYSKVLQPTEAEDFAYFKAQFSLDDDLAFACVKVYQAVDKVPPALLPRLLEVPSKLAERRQRILLAGLMLTRGFHDLQFMDGFVTKILTHVPDPAGRAEILAYVKAQVDMAAVRHIVSPSGTLPQGLSGGAMGEGRQLSQGHTGTV